MAMASPQNNEQRPDPAILEYMPEFGHSGTRGLGPGNPKGQKTADGQAGVPAACRLGARLLASYSCGLTDLNRV